MPAGTISGFGGIVPRAGPRFLRENEAQTASNVRLTNGEFIPLRAPLDLNLPAQAVIEALYRMVDASGADYLLTWDRDVDAVRGPIEDDPTYRTYFTGDGEPRVTNLPMAISGTPYPAQWFVLGVTPPLAAPVVSHAGGSGNAVSRAFRYTFVTQWGEESAPSPESPVVTGRVDGSWTVGMPQVAPLNAFTVTGASWALGVATLNVASTFGLRVGEEMGVAGVSPAGFNGTRRKITAVTASSVSFQLGSNPGTFVSGGTITRRAPHNTSGMLKRLYWSETTAAGDRYAMVAEVSAATTSIAVAGNTAAGISLATVGWRMPPADLQGIVALPSGGMAGFRANEVHFTPANVPYAWPYSEALAHDVVGMGVTGSTLIVGTTGSPYSISGLDPQTMQVLQESYPFPCLSKRSFAVLEGQVAYAAPQGLVGAAGARAFQIITRNAYTQEEWRKLMPSTFKAAAHQGKYVTSHQSGETRQVLIIDPVEFASATTANVNAGAFYGDKASGRLYLSLNNEVHEWDANEGVRLIGEWMSKEFLWPYMSNQGVVKVDSMPEMTEAEEAAALAAREAVIASNQAMLDTRTADGWMGGRSLNKNCLGGSRTRMLPPAFFQSCQIQIITDGIVRDTREVIQSEWLRLRAGYKSDHAAYRISGNVRVKMVHFAETVKQSRGV